MYEGLRLLENGDEFTVFDNDGSTMWFGIIDQDDKTGAIPHTATRKGKVVKLRGWKQQVVGGWWVHWIQRRMDPEDWGELFDGNKRCLIRRPEAITPIGTGQYPSGLWIVLLSLPFVLSVLR